MSAAPDLDHLYRGFVPPAETHEVAPGVFATLQPDGSWGLSNAGFLVDDGEVCVVDTLLTESRTRRFREDIRRETGQDDVRFLINTHHHSDHTFGNFVFDDATIIAHAGCREAVIATGLSPMGRDPFVPWGEIRLRPPEVAFEGRLTLHVGATEVHLIHVGPAHTREDVIVWLPEKRVLFTGDVLFTEGTPILMAGSLAGSRAALDLMESLQPSVIVPGHGALAGVAQIQHWRSYFDFVADAAARALDRGETPLAAARGLDLGEFAAWVNPERIVLNLHRAMAEAAGAEAGVALDEAAIFADMIRFEPSAYGHKLIAGRETYREVERA
ncbi:MBL fold metallo-hydrolase [Microbacterium sp. RD1]|uniref:MBL fold metallo-hydrolase n=1 Tax=Microbacterium sp. RD1 TaxID=3457313 RepID=UPI003FA5C01D